MALFLDSEYVKEIFKMGQSLVHSDRRIQSAIDKNLAVEYSQDNTKSITDRSLNGKFQGRSKFGEQPRRSTDDIQISSNGKATDKRDTGLQKSTVRRPERKTLIEKFNRRLELNGDLLDSYKASRGINFPFYDNTILRQIKSTNPGSVPRLPKIPNMEEVRSVDRDSLRRYTTNTKTVSRTAYSLIVSSGVSAAKALGIIDHDLRFKTVGIEESCKRASANNSSSGWPLFRRKNSTSAIADTSYWLDFILRKPSVYSLFKNPLLLNPQYLAHRFQIRFGEDLTTPKISIRQVWVLPQRIIALENYFFGNVLDHYKLNNINSSEPLTNTGLKQGEVSSRVIRRLRGYLNGYEGRCLYSTDYSKFDSTIPEYAMDIFFSIFRKHIIMNKNEAKLYNLLRYYSKKTPAIIDNELIVFERGMSSGSLLTHLFDTWWNLTLWYIAKWILENESEDFDWMSGNYMAFDMLDKYCNRLIFTIMDKRRDIALCGDDTLIYTRAAEVYIHQNICRSLGMNCSIEFTCCSPKDITKFIGKYWNSDNEPVQTEKYFTAHIVFRTSWFDKKTTDFDISEYLHIYRILGIVTQFANGWNYLHKTFGNWKPFKRFIKERHGIKVISGGYTEKEYLSFDELLSWERR